MSQPRARFVLFVLAAAAPATAHAFVRTETSTGDAVSWDRRCIPWHISNRGTPDVSFDAARTAVQRSFATWQNVDCSDLELTAQGLTNIEMVGFRPDLKNVNVVLWREEGEWDHSSMIIGLTTVTYCERAEGDLCAYSGLVLDADIELNGESFTFTTSQVPGRTRDPRGRTLHRVRPQHRHRVDHVRERTAGRDDEGHSRRRRRERVVRDLSRRQPGPCV
jgi:hypothetical protein